MEEIDLPNAGKSYSSGFKEKTLQTSKQQTERQTVLGEGPHDHLQVRRLAGRTHGAQHSHTAVTDPSEGTPAKISKGNGTWGGVRGAQGTSFREFPPNEVRQDVSSVVYQVHE